MWKETMITLNTHKLLKTPKSRTDLLAFTKQFSKYPKSKEPLARSLMLLAIGKACYNYLGGLMKPNFFRIFGNVYYCKTQKGFVNAAYDMLGADPSYTKGDVKKMVRGYPEKYPALVSFTDQTFEASRILVEWLPIENLSESAFNVFPPPPKKYPELWELDDFLEWCRFGMLTDNDGYEYYSNSSDNHEPFKEFIVRPSDVIKDNVKYDYKYVHWYKKEQT